MSYQQSTEATAPGAPPTDVRFAGYENIGFDAAIPKPFMPNEPVVEPAATRPGFQNVPFLSEDEAKEALLTFVKTKCCYGKKPLKNMTFTNLQSSNTNRYILQTFTETRTTAWASEPYMGQPLGNNGMQPPLPWDIQVQPLAMFSNELRLIEVPNTAYVKSCDSCYGSGGTKCLQCDGRGRKSCVWCHGSGRVAHVHADTGHGSSNPGYSGPGATRDDGHHHHHHHEHHHEHHHQTHTDYHSCNHCSGSGLESCLMCNCSGRIICKICKGRGNLKWFIQLSVKFDNNVDDYLKKTESIPDEMIRNCQAQGVFNEQNVRLFPINHHKDPEINNASYNLINSHIARFANSRILAQRHEVNIIPITQCNYSYNEKPFTFYVFGLDHQVYSPDYPQKCCCTIL